MGWRGRLHVISYSGEAERARFFTEYCSGFSGVSQGSLAMNYLNLVLLNF